VSEDPIIYLLNNHNQPVELGQEEICIQMYILASVFFEKDDIRI
jgi:hypothetical protein